MGFLKLAPGLFEIGTMVRFSRNGFFFLKQTLWTGLFLMNGLFKIGTMGSLKSVLWTGLFLINGLFEIGNMGSLKSALWTGLFPQIGFILKWTFSATALSGWCVMLVRYVRLCESRPLSVLGSFCVFHASSFGLHDAFHKALLDP